MKLMERIITNHRTPIYLFRCSYCRCFPSPLSPKKKYELISLLHAENWTGAQIPENLPKTDCYRLKAYQNSPCVCVCVTLRFGMHQLLANVKIH